ncbi:DNA polymerase [Trueperella pyogenes]|uniref:DNA polymerase n=1 Tax=Trueperella pyogenes TaxID=1661 RepID=UPI0023DDB96C|nr:DNA polymerase [Trueperella pyogenes]
MKTLNIDIETFSSVNLSKSGVYKYASSLDFEILLFAYSVDRGPVHVVDLAQGEKLPDHVRVALTDPAVTKWAFNAAFERVCLSAWLYGDGTMLDPAQWRCTMVWAAYLGLPMSLDQVGVVLDIERKKIREGKALIKKFCAPSPASFLNGGGNRVLPSEDPQAWEEFKTYNARDVDVEMQIQHRLRHHPVPDTEWAHYVHDQHINDLGIGIDLDFAQAAIACDDQHRQRLTRPATDLTGLANPNSPLQLMDWLEEHDYWLPSLTKGDVETALTTATGDVKTVLELRQELSRSSVKKYQAMENCETGGRAHGLLQFYGAGRTGRYAGRLIQVQNLPRNYLPDLDAARGLVKAGEFEALELLYPSVSDTLSQLIRTAFTPADGHYFVVADYSAIEARVLAWLAGETSTLDAFRAGKDLYCETASRMFGVPVEKHGRNAELRQKGKIATLACGYGGSVGALTAMGALRMGLAETELKPIVDAWRAANPNVVRLWWAVDQAAMTAVEQRTPTSTRGLGFTVESGILFVTLPSGRQLAYVKPAVGVNRFGGQCITYRGVSGGHKWSTIDTYGPKLVENIVQAIARDLLAEAIGRVREAGHKVVMHIHDEIVVETADATVDQISALMCAPPGWAEGLPLAADGYQCDFYKKD